ncbi:undecaprenyldiphospho-muramoylpentapeptide beta-N-acetylglucosaminyltransferase [Lichenihabitans psoromatis]|uniref:undecaprenyldiphospho-muramoylpentapeptide beta-N-acetylglucosaminyltransferase n=1 Tax=Lichenihabitans psoromatis TaxID=2528642 RepID=UPI00103550D8|nr:undecaprenyldiphospho-muramoylpentapeptide beta-N-acetylglucosaminyltransferase [Lichenihabitans psoromatis]
MAVRIKTQRHNGPVLVAAGGTGGHLFPAEALSRALGQRNIPVELVTDTRALAYADTFPADAIHAVRAATPTGGSALSKVNAMLTLGRGSLQARALLGRINPCVVVGFGGYPTVPPMVAALSRRIPVILHEQNAVIGRANAFLARGATAIATGFETLGRASAGVLAKATHTGNPVRPAVLAAAASPYPGFADGMLRILVTGGSQGARVMSDVVPSAIALLDDSSRQRLIVVQQARGEDEARVRAVYREAGVQAEVAPFFADLPARIGAAHLVIARAGASTVSELAVIGRPSILVPFPHALDQDQAANAQILQRTGAALVVRQSAFTPDALARELNRILASPAEILAPQAAQAKRAGLPDAAERLADLVLTIAGVTAHDAAASDIASLQGSLVR